MNHKSSFYLSIYVCLQFMAENLIKKKNLKKRKLFVRYLIRFLIPECISFFLTFFFLFLYANVSVEEKEKITEKGNKLIESRYGI